jgi:flagellar biosynthetic protein FliR/FlhB
MADEKSEQPTQHKLDEARKKGQVAKSQDAVTAFVFIGVLLCLSFAGKNTFILMSNALRSSLRSFTEIQLTPDNLPIILNSALWNYATLLAPFGLLAVLTGIIGNLVQTGWLVSLESLNPKADRLNPIEGAKKIYSTKGFVEAIKVLIRTLLIVVVFYSFFKGQLPTIVSACKMFSNSAYSLFWTLTMSLLGKITLLMIVMGALDYILQRYMFQKDMMMTKQEVKEEFKSQEGDPFLKSRLRQKQRELIKKRMMDGVKTSRVVITNPTHYACALKFDEEEDEAPILTAKGKDLMAEQIKKLAREHQVPIHENKPLAQSLYKDVEVGQMIPEDMYQAVAEVIAFLERLDQGMSPGQQQPGNQQQGPINPEQEEEEPDAGQ